MTRQNTLNELLKTKGKELGFSQVGVAPAVTPFGFHKLLDWIAAGYCAGMSWIERRKDAYRHPDGVMPGTRSVIMAAMNYDDGSCIPPGVRVAKYASGADDYHDVLRSRLALLADVIRKEIPIARTRVVVDTAPLLERDFARLAGLGWVGKNTMLISRTIGSWFFLGAVLTDVELDYDEAMDHSFCGSCTRCLDACPTQAFPSAGVLDARRCISYLTIEHRRDAIPHALREGIGEWLFGCDVCQEVCPWNRFSPKVTIPEFERTQSLSPVNCRELLGLSEEGFRDRFRGTPIYRLGRAGLLRNASIVLANQGDVSAVPELQRLLTEPEPMLRETVIWALEKLHSELQ